MAALLPAFPLFLGAPVVCGQEEPPPGVSFQAVSFEQVDVQDEFWRPRLETTKRVTLEVLFRELEHRGYLRNFELAAGASEGSHRGQPTDDAELYQWIEAASRALRLEPDEALEERLDTVIATVAAAQDESGYLGTYHTVVEPEERWKNLRSGYELFSAAHLIEAGIAHWRATGERDLLDVAVRCADHVASVFGPGKLGELPGHPGIEDALLELAEVTSNEQYSALAEHMLLRRGAKERKWKYGSFAQDEVPLLEQRLLTGHAVRATYLYTGLAHLARLTGDQEHLSPLLSIWRDTRLRKMYVTGGIGHTAPDAGFERLYELPNDTALCETCAAVGMVRWTHRMFLATRHANLADALERTLYNNLLAGVSVSGDRFSYRNPLAAGGDHERVRRPDPSCCPPNLARTLCSIGGLVYAHDDENVFLVLYVGSSAEIELPGGRFRITQETNYPTEGEVRIRIEPESEVSFTLHVRIPGWCEDTFTIGVNGAETLVTVTHGDDPGTWLTFQRTWRKGDVLELELPMTVERVHADDRVEADRDRVALRRGPVVYAFESADNGGSVSNLYLPQSAAVRAVWDPDLFGGVYTASGLGREIHFGESGARTPASRLVVAVPYHLWGNRDPGEMAVWIPEKAELCHPPERDR